MSQANATVIDPDIEVLREAFGQVFQLTNPRPFGSSPSGFSDGNEGVQWNTGVDRQTGVAWLGVNLEGKAYDGWPIARLIQRELDDTQLFATRARLEESQHIRVLFRRDAWAAGGSRIPSFNEQFILPRDTTLSKLDADAWRRSLIIAQECLATPEGKRAKRPITLKDGQRIEIQVSPHLSFERPMHYRRGVDEMRTIMLRVRGELQPLYDFVRQQSA